MSREPHEPPPCFDRATGESDRASETPPLPYCCPRCRSPLVADHKEHLLRCTNARCAYSRLGFPLIEGQPVLIDFEASLLSRSALCASGAASVLRRRRSRAKLVIYGLLFGSGSSRSRLNARAMRDQLKTRAAKPVLLIVGGGTMGEGCDVLYRDPAMRIVSFDVYRSVHTDFVADAHSIPLADGCVDGVWLQAVLEHVLEPERVVEQVLRVLKQDGLVYAETPFLQAVHEGAYDFTRYTESGHRWLFRHFERLDSGVVRGPGTVLVWAINHAMAGLFRSRKIGRMFSLLFFWLRFIDTVTPKAFAIDGASGVYFLGRKAATPIAPREIVAHYAGAQR